jgi:hypothetical protein
LDKRPSPVLEAMPAIVPETNAEKIGDLFVFCDPPQIGLAVRR